MSKKMAKAAAEHILDERWDGKFPVDVVGIARAIGVEVMAFADKDIPYSGAYTPRHARNGGKPTIIVNQHEAPTRQRFTIAHELGHHILHGDVAFRDPLHQFPGADPREVEANVFAANMLMPERNFRSMVDSGKYTEKTLRERLGVSPAALWNRLDGLGY